MCGIAGAINWGDVTTLKCMTDMQAHRGPDDQGIWQTTSARGDWVGLGSRRLAILDLSSAGHMPMFTPDERYVIVYNGEVYNYPALRNHLEAKGYTFRSGSDTEAILYLYQEYGCECVKRLNGMFAIAIWDNIEQTLFLARDHFGIKPLYYCHQGSKLAFASEIKSLLKLPGMPRRLHHYALHQYLSFLWVPDPWTMFDEIVKLPAGHYAMFADGELNLVQYWDLPFPASDHLFPTDEQALAEEFRERFAAIVQAQMLSDVPLGAFLSAGLDSSSIVGLMKRYTNQPIRTFTITFPEKYRKGELTLDDTAVAQRTADYFGCHHTEILMEPDVTALLPKLLWHMDEPTADPAIIAAYLVNQAARQHVTVLLSGVGGDELFAGYRRYQAHYLAERYRQLPALARHAFIEPLAAALPAFRSTRIKGLVRLTKKMVRSGSLPPRDRFIMDNVFLSESQKQALYTARSQSVINGFDPRFRHFTYFDRVAHADFLNQMLYLDSKAFMTSLNLAYNDKMSMASSLEVRVPFLDWELAEWVAFNIAPRLKLHNGTLKYFLRQAMQPLLPGEVLRQKKAGFGAPIDYWLAFDLREMTDDLLSERAIQNRGLFQADAVRRLITEHRNGQEDWSLQIWQLLTLELWQQQFQIS